MQDPEFENEHVCVWKTILTPDSPLILGEHKIVFCHREGMLQQIDHRNLSEPTEVMIVEMKPLKNTPLPNRPID